MKVRTGFTFDDTALRTIRAASGQGGVATRRDCVTFIDRAVRDALKRAPEPKPARTRVTRPAPAPVVVVADEQAQAIANRERVRRLYMRGVEDHAIAAEGSR